MPIKKSANLIIINNSENIEFEKFKDQFNKKKKDWKVNLNIYILLIFAILTIFEIEIYYKIKKNKSI